MSLAARAEALLSRLWWRPRPAPLSWLLWPLSWVYLAAWAWTMRRAATARALPVPVLVVGNLVVGGAGKTPTVIAVVQALQQAGHRPGVVSRGHGRHGEGATGVQDDSPVAEVGDEPLLIRRRCRVPVWVGRDRASAALALCRTHPEVDVLVADDGLQHKALARQAELLVFDDRGIGNGLLLPAGPLRQPWPAMPAANARVLYTGSRISTRWPGALTKRRADVAWPLAAWHAGDASAAQPLQALRGRTLLAVAGLAAPQKFFDMLQAAGLTCRSLPLPDHHDYSTLPWPPGTPELVTTEKDAVKLRADRLGATRAWVVPLDLQLPPGLVAELTALLFARHEP